MIAVTLRRMQGCDHEDTREEPHLQKPRPEKLTPHHQPIARSAIGPCKHRRIYLTRLRASSENRTPDAFRHSTVRDQPPSETMGHQKTVIASVNDKPCLRSFDAAHEARLLVLQRDFVIQE